MNRNFNASISVLGIKEPKVQQAILKLLENSLFQKELLGKTSDTLTENIRRLRQQMSNMKFEIDPEKAQQIADMISEVIGDSVREAKAASQTAVQSASTASEKADAASRDAADVARKLDDMEETIEEKAEQAASTAISQVTENVQHAVADAQSAAQGAQNAASAATNSAQNAATTAQQASNAAQQATNAVKNLAFRSLASATTYNATYDQYRKIATLPAVSSAVGASITFFGSLGGWTESSLRQVMVSVCQRQSETTYTALDALGYAFRASLQTCADICIYKESNNTFSVYLKGVKATYFKHNLGMIYNEQVTPVEDTFKTSTPTGTLVWNLLAHYKLMATSEDVSTAITNMKNAANTWAAAQTFTSRITANGRITSVGVNSSYVSGRDNAAFRCNVATTGYVPLASAKSNTGSWEIGTYTANNELHFVFITDANYNSGTNNTTVNIVMTQNGQIYGVTAPAADNNSSYVPTTAWVRTLLAAIDTWAKTQYFNDGLVSSRGSSHVQTKSTAMVKGTVSASELYAGHIRFCDKNGNAISEEYNYVPANTSTVTFLKRMWSFLSSGSTYKDVILAQIDTSGNATISFVNCKNCYVPDPAGGIWSNNNEAVNTRTLNSFVAASRPYVEYYSHSILNQDLGAGSTAFPMSAMVSNTSATYNVKVTFHNTASTARSCVVNGVTVSLASGAGALASRQFTLAGSGTLTIDNIATSVDVFITIWR